MAIPTETVYGLAGWIKSEAGLKNIFSTKERPFFDPLIVHVHDIAAAKKCTTDWTQAHEVLARACWPGPLTLIAKKHPDISSLITSGLDSVGLRCPNHPETLKLLSSIEGGLAAPSANKFGKTSPTSAQHVAEEFQNQVAILDGGHCEVGIESTVAGIIQVGNEYTVEIFRPGFYTATMLKEILLKHFIDAKVIYAESPVAPGQLKHHYMPKIPLVITKPNTQWNQVQKMIETNLGQKFSKPAMWTLSHDPHLASRELYENLRNFDDQGFDIILTPFLLEHNSEEWMGIWNRLNKAKTLSLTS